MVVKKDKIKDEGFAARKPKRLSEKDISIIFEKRKISIERRKDDREEKRKIKLEEMAKEPKFVPKEEMGKRGITTGALFVEGTFDRTDPRKKKEVLSPPLEDSAGVCYDEEKDVKLELSDDGKFEKASVNGVELNL